MIWLRNLLLLCFVIYSHGASIETKNRIQNGYDASPREIKYQVFIRRAPTHSLLCGGSILNKEYVITAAHCVISTDGVLKPSQIEVLDMTVAHPFNYEGPDGLHYVTEIISHENFNHNNTLTHDIALLKVSPAFDFTITDPVILPKPGLKMQPSTDAVVSGWGTTNYRYTTNPETLQSLTVRIIENDLCRLPYLNTPYKIYPTHLCTHVLDRVERGACSGDSGGPLVIHRNILIGIVSWSEKYGACGTYPDVYTRVSEYVDWIQKHAQLDEDDDSIITFPDNEIFNSEEI